jgi:DGQHR domain-containing protein
MIGRIDIDYPSEDRPPLAESATIEFPCLEIRQPIGPFFIGIMEATDLVRISYSDIIRIDKDERDIEVVSGLERTISKTRVKELQEYVNVVDAAFPTGVIISIEGRDAEFLPATRTMKVRKATYVAKVIDGQHRIEGLKGFGGQTFQMNVTIFINMDPEDQAMVFSTINLKQAPVAKSITYELFEYAKTRSPQKSCHQIARLLDRTAGSPFKDKLMILGVARDPDNETLTQAAFIKPLQKLIVKDKEAMKDRDILKRRRELKRPGQEEVRVNNLVFRNWFIDGQDSMIAQTMVNYFLAVSEKWPTAWTVKKTANILNRTTGYDALMRFLPLVLFRLGIDELHSLEEFKAIFAPVSLQEADFNPDQFRPGSSGTGLLWRRLMANTGITENEAWKNRPTLLG